MSYRPPIDGLGTCRQCGADVADGVTFCPECGARQLPAHGAAPSPAPVRRQWWMPVAIAIGGLAAIGGGALLAIALNGRPDDENGLLRVAGIGQRKVASYGEEILGIVRSG